MCTNWDICPAVVHVSEFRRLVSLQNSVDYLVLHDKKTAIYIISKSEFCGILISAHSSNASVSTR